MDKLTKWKIDKKDKGRGKMYKKYGIFWNFLNIKRKQGKEKGLYSNNIFPYKIFKDNA